MEIVREIHKYPYAKGAKQELDLKSFRLCGQLAFSPRQKIGAAYNEVPFLFRSEISRLDSPRTTHCVLRLLSRNECLVKPSGIDVEHLAAISMARDDRTVRNVK